MPNPARHERPIIDTNYLLAREQISLMRAAAAESAGARKAHAGLAREYGTLLAEKPCPYRFARTPDTAHI